MGIGIGNSDWGLGNLIGDGDWIQECEIWGSRIEISGLGFEIGVGDRDLGLGIGMGEWD